MQKLDDTKIRYIIRARERGDRASDIARNLSISRRRVEQVYAYYRMHGEIPVLRRVGRKVVPISDTEKSVILDSHKRYRVGALYLKRRIESDYGIHINHDRIARVLKMYGQSPEPPRRWIRRKWVRHERAYSNSLWHVDWYEMKDQRWRGMQLIVYEIE